MTTLRPRTVWRTAAAWLALHAAIWLPAARYARSHYPWPADARNVLEYWDAWHYSLISRFGYEGPVRWAFYPLYPMLVRLLAWPLGLATHPEVVGTIFSTLLFAGFCWLQARLLAAPNAPPFVAPDTAPDVDLGALRPATLWGWLCLLCWPAAWVFHSNHTESLFLLLSLLALVAARRGHWLAAAAFAGLCALTRNQGVFLAFAVALDGALRAGRDWRRRALVFCGSGLVSAALYACWPAYQWWRAGDPLTSFHAQAQFYTPAASLAQAVASIWFANPSSHVTWGFYFHHVLYLAAHVALALLLLRREWALACYAALSLWVPLYQAHLENTYRYTVVLFPALFVLGDGAGRLPPALRWALFGGLFSLHVLCTYYYAVGEWAY